MRRADIEINQWHAVKTGYRHIERALVLAAEHPVVRRNVGVAFSVRIEGRTRWYGSHIPLTHILMPWTAWEAKEADRKARDAAVQAERERHAQLVEQAIDEQWALNLQIQELRGELAARGVENYKHSGHGVTLSWADLAKVLGMKAP